MIKSLEDICDDSSPGFTLAIFEESLQRQNRASVLVKQGGSPSALLVISDPKTSHVLLDNRGATREVNVSADENMFSFALPILRSIFEDNTDEDLYTQGMLEIVAVCKKRTAERGIAKILISAAELLALRNGVPLVVLESTVSPVLRNLRRRRIINISQNEKNKINNLAKVYDRFWRRMGYNYVNLGEEYEGRLFKLIGSRQVRDGVISENALTKLTNEIRNFGVGRKESLSRQRALQRVENSMKGTIRALNGAVTSETENAQELNPKASIRTLLSGDGSIMTPETRPDGTRRGAVDGARDWSSACKLKPYTDGKADITTAPTFQQCAEAGELGLYSPDSQEAAGDGWQNVLLGLECRFDDIGGTVRVSPRCTRRQIKRVMQRLLAEKTRGQLEDETAAATRARTSMEVTEGDVNEIDSQNQEQAIERLETILGDAYRNGVVLGPRKKLFGAAAAAVARRGARAAPAAPRRRRAAPAAPDAPAAPGAGAPREPAAPRRSPRLRQRRRS
jgi:hypothetical protein